MHLPYSSVAHRFHRDGQTHPLDNATFSNRYFLDVYTATGGGRRKVTPFTKVPQLHSVLRGTGWSRRDGLQEKYLNERNIPVLSTRGIVR